MPPNLERRSADVVGSTNRPRAGAAAACDRHGRRTKLTTTTTGRPKTDGATRWTAAAVTTGGRTRTTRTRTTRKTFSSSSHSSEASSTSSTSASSSNTSAAAYNRRKVGNNVRVGRSSSAPAVAGDRSRIALSHREGGRRRTAPPHPPSSSAAAAAAPSPAPAPADSRSRRRAKSMPSHFATTSTVDDRLDNGRPSPSTPLDDGTRRTSRENDDAGWRRGGDGGRRDGGAGGKFYTNNLEGSWKRRSGRRVGARRSASSGGRENNIRAPSSSSSSSAAAAAAGFRSSVRANSRNTRSGREGGGGGGGGRLAVPSPRRGRSARNDERIGDERGVGRSSDDKGRSASVHNFVRTSSSRRGRSTSNDEIRGERRVRSSSDHHRGAGDDNNRATINDLDCDSRSRTPTRRGGGGGRLPALSSRRARSTSNDEGRRMGRSSSDHRRGAGDDNKRSTSVRPSSSQRWRSTSNDEGGGGRRGRRGRSTSDHHRDAGDVNERTTSNYVACSGRSPTPTRRGGGGVRLTRRRSEDDNIDQVDRSYGRVSSKEKTLDPLPSSGTGANDNVWTDEADFRRHRRRRLQRLREGEHRDVGAARRMTGRGVGTSNRDEIITRSDVDYRRINSMPMPRPSTRLSRYPEITCDLANSTTGISIVSPIASLDSSWIYMQAKRHRLRREMELRQVTEDRLFKDWKIRRSKSCDPKSSSDHAANESAIVPYEKPKNQKKYILDILGLPELDGSERSRSRQRISSGTATTFHRRAPDPVATPVMSMQSLSTCNTMTPTPSEEYRMMPHPPTDGIERTMRDYDGSDSTLDDSFIGCDESQSSNPTPHNKRCGYGNDFDNDLSHESSHIDAHSMFRTKRQGRPRQISSGADTWHKISPESPISLPETGDGGVSCEIPTPNPLKEYSLTASDIPKARIKRSMDPSNPAVITDHDARSASTTKENTASQSDSSHEIRSGSHGKDKDVVSDVSQYDDASPTLRTNEIKTNPDCTVPPLHASILSKKPSLLPLRTPPHLPARSWGKKLRDNPMSVRYSAHKESKEGGRSEEKSVCFADSLASLPAASRTKLGYEVDVNSNNSSNQISEVTMPNMRSEPMLVQALKRYQHLTQNMANPPDMSRLIEKSQKVAVPVPPPPLSQGQIIGTVEQRQQSAIPMPPSSHPPEHDNREAEQQQKADVPWMPPPPPPRPPVLKISPQSKHQKTMNRLTFVREINASVAAVLKNTNGHHPHLQHQSQPHQAMNIQGRQRDQANETPTTTRIPSNTPRVSPPLPQTTNQPTEEMVIQSSPSLPSPQAMVRSTEETMKSMNRSMGERPPCVGGRKNTSKRGSHCKGRVENLPFTDDNGDAGMYTGETNEYGHPHGKGRMKYENGVFFEGKWVNGVRDGGLAQRERLMTGFSSWNGPKKNHAHGMIWVDPLGNSGRYTGNLNQEGLPHGIGLMSYSSGLNAEGMWVNGRLINDNSQGNPSPSIPGMVGG